jgi:hypothetical protein
MGESNMIYEYPKIDEPIRQGDIFVGLPRIDISLSCLPVIGANDEAKTMSWGDIAKDGKPITALFSAKPVAAIVSSQDCDALRSPDITLCEIRQFVEVERKCVDTKLAKKWVSIITQQARLNQKWFYLPPDLTIGFETKMGVDFLVTLCLPRHDLESLRYLRMGRLNSIADEHFRERISEFYRRYPYDEWYALSREEMDAYRNDHPDAECFSWQK